MNKQGTIISKDKTQIIKGFAILFMIAHHCLIKEFYINPPSFLSTLICIKFYTSMKICVGLFTFFVGYGFFFSDKVNTIYIFKHIWRLLKNYWIVLITTLVISILGGYVFSFSQFVYSIFGFIPTYNLANWYVYFYIYALFILPIIKNILNKDIWKRGILIIIFFYSIFFLTNEHSILFKTIHRCCQYSPILVLGFICAKTQVLTNLSKHIQKNYIWLFFAIVSLAIRCMGIKGISTDIVSVPLFIISVSALINNGMVARFLSNLGRNSTMMWFIHAIPFSTATNFIFQNSIFWINNTIVLYILITTTSYIAALGVNKVFPTLKKL